MYRSAVAMLTQFFLIHCFQGRMGTLTYSLKLQTKYILNLKITEILYW